MVTSDRKLVGLLLAGVFLLSLATLPGHMYSIDGMSYYRSATSLAWHGSLLLEPPIVWGGAVVSPDWPIGFSLVMAPVAFLLSPFQQLQPVFDEAVPLNLRLLYEDQIYELMSWINGFVVALTCAACFALGRELGLSRRISVGAGLSAGLASPLFFYGHADFAQPLTALLLVLAVVLAIRTRRGVGAVSGFALLPVVGLAVATRPLEGLITLVAAGALLAWPDAPGGARAWAQPRKIAAGGAAIAGAAIGAAVTLFVNAVRRGDPLDSGYTLFDTIDPVGTLLAYLISPGRGVPWHFPLILLAPLGFLALWRAGKRPEAVAIALGAGALLPAYLVWSTLGDVAYGPRFLVPAFPLLTVAAFAAVPSGSRALRWACAGLATAGASANLALLATDQLQYWFVRGDNHALTPGFWRQFELGAYAPAAAVKAVVDGSSTGIDIVWIRRAAETGGVSLAIMGVLLAGAVAALWIAAIRSGRDRIGPNLPVMR